MKVTIVMATFNAGLDLPGCLESIAAHAPGVPLVVQDGGSEDETLDLLSGVRAKVISQPDAGIYDALTRAIARVETEFVYILGADDRLLPGWGRMASGLQNPDTVVYGDVEMMSDGRLYAGEFDAGKLARTNLCQQAVFYPAGVFKAHPFNPRFSLQADWALHLACWADPAWSFQYEPQVVCQYNDQQGSSSLRYDRAFMSAYPQLLWRYLPKRYFVRRGLPAWLAHHTRELRGKTTGH